MKKTTVYLPDELKGRLEAAAAASGRSEADLIREGIEQIVEIELTPRPRAPLWSAGGGIAEHVDEILFEGFGKD